MPITKLTALRGMPLEKLEVSCNPQLRDLSPLKGMLLKRLNIYNTGVVDLRPLKGMPLKELTINAVPIDTTPVNDIKGLVINRY